MRDIMSIEDFMGEAKGPVRLNASTVADLMKAGVKDGSLVQDADGTEWVIDLDNAKPSDTSVYGQDSHDNDREVRVKDLVLLVMAEGTSSPG